MQRMGRIGEPEMPQSVGNQQVAEFVVNICRRNRVMRQQGQPQQDRQ